MRAYDTHLNHLIPRQNMSISAFDGERCPLELAPLKQLLRGTGGFSDGCLNSPSSQ
jgi:hypothetical protein